MPDTYRDLAQCLAQAIGNLLSHRGPQGHWGDARSTALAVWALNEVISGRNAGADSLPELRATTRDATAWLVGQARREDGGYSWESEAWDTALAILALVSSSDTSERVDQGVAWLNRIRDPESGVWYDEVWETTLATVALVRSERSRQRPVHDLSLWLEPVLKWFLTIPSKESGEFVCQHYSGFLAWILGEVRATRHAAAIQNSETYRMFRDKAMAAVRYLLNPNVPAKRSWCSYTFANAYISYGLSVLSRFETIDTSYSSIVVDWLGRHQGACGGFEDTEDTAIAVAALSALLDVHEEGRRAYEAMARMVPKPPRTTQRCFLGYSGKSKPVALEIKESLTQRLPVLEIRDWRWDFQLGRNLMSEIESVSRECQVAVFLVTKDDQLLQSGNTLVDSPRDNIVFEVGYFAARIGLEHTLLVVEKGARLPSDWGGIIYISLQDRNNLGDVNLALLDAIKKVLRL